MAQIRYRLIAKGELHGFENCSSLRKRPTKQGLGCDDGSPETEWNFVFAGFKESKSGIAGFWVWIIQETNHAITPAP